MCGIVGVWNYPNASRIAAACSSMILHRGEDGCSVSSNNNERFFVERRGGSIREQFDSNHFPEEMFREKLPGDYALAHNRYATVNSENSHPVRVRDSRLGEFLLIHNGTIPNYQEWREKFKKMGYCFNSTSDTEVFVVAILASGESDFEKALLFALKILPFSYAMIIMTNDKMYAIQDKYGMRPMILHRIGEGYLLCSESFPADQLKQNNSPTKYIADVESGSMLIFEKGKKGYRKEKYVESPVAGDMFCGLCAAYFSHLYSKKNGVPFYYFRRRIGATFKTLNLKGVVISVPDSGNSAAEGYFLASGNPLWTFFNRNHNPTGGQNRTFTDPVVGDRYGRVGWKLHAPQNDTFPDWIDREDELLMCLEDKIAIIVDDSVIRANTLRKVVEIIKPFKPRKIIALSAFPLVKKACYYGIAFPEETRLVGHNRSMAGIRDYIGLDDIYYPSRDTFRKIFKEIFHCDLCEACTGGRTPE